MTKSIWKPDELALDQHFWNKLSEDRTFFDWIVSKSKFAGGWLDLDRSEKWHQRWFRDPETGLDSETDITIFLLETRLSKRFAIHIENKPPHGRWQPNQPQNYRRRAENRCKKWGHDDFDTALMAPRDFLAAHANEASNFGFTVNYEDVADFVPQFGRDKD